MSGTAIKWAVFVLLVAGLVAAAWLYVPPHLVDRLRGYVPSFTQPAASARKCSTPKSVVYTDGACPAGSREQALTQGTVSVVPGQRQAAADAPASSASSRSVLRELAGPPIDAAATKNKMIEAAMER